MSQKTVILIDDHPVVSLGVSLSFREHADLLLVGTATTIASAFALLDAAIPQALIVDLAFTGKIDMSIILKLRHRAPRAAIIVFSSLPESLYAEEAYANGADAFVSKDKDLDQLIEMLKDLLLQPASHRRQALRRASVRPEKLPLETIHLTPREKEIARHLSEGRSIAQIARLVGVSANTVAAHRDNVRRKFDCRDSTELVARLARFYSSGISQ